MKILLEPKDYSDIRDVMLGILDFVPSDSLIDFTLKQRPELLARAAAWDWDDSEVRDQLAEALEDDDKMLRSPHG